MKSPIDFLRAYISSFPGLTDEQSRNFEIKKEHSLRVAQNSLRLVDFLKLNKEDRKVAFLTGLFHDIGRFKQLFEFNTFHDAKSIDHADLGVQVLKEQKVFSELGHDLQEIIFVAVKHHNKFEVPVNLADRELLHVQLLRDADKLDILKVLTDYYTRKNQPPNHTLTWELPSSDQVSPGVAKEVLDGKLVSKNEVKNETDVKIMQLSWVYDIHFKPSYELIFQNRFLEKIFNSLPKNNLVIEIYRKIKVFAENKLKE